MFKFKPRTALRSYPSFSDLLKAEPLLVHGTKGREPEIEEENEDSVGNEEPQVKVHGVKDSSLTPNINAVMAGFDETDLYPSDLSSNGQSNGKTSGKSDGRSFSAMIEEDSEEEEEEDDDDEDDEDEWEEEEEEEGDTSVFSNSIKSNIRISRSAPIKTPTAATITSPFKSKSPTKNKSSFSYGSRFSGSPTSSPSSSPAKGSASPSKGGYFSVMQSSKQRISKEDQFYLQQRERRIRQGRLLLVSLLENFCELFDQAPERSRVLFFTICKQLSNMGIIHSEDFIDELASVRSTYKRAFKELVVQAMMAIREEQFLQKALPSSSITLANSDSSSSSSSTSSTTDSPPNVKALHLSRLTTSPTSASAANHKKTPPTSPFSPRSPYSPHNHPHRSPSSISISIPTPDDLTTLLLDLQPSRFREDFVSTRRLGKGAFGSVWRVTHRLDGREYAVKIIRAGGASGASKKRTFAWPKLGDNVGNEDEDDEFWKILREVKAQAQFFHPNVVRYYSAWLEHHAFVDNGDEDEDDGEEESEDSEDSKEEDGQDFVSFDESVDSSSMSSSSSSSTKESNSSSSYSSSSSSTKSSSDSNFDSRQNTQPTRKIRARPTHSRSLTSPRHSHPHLPHGLQHHLPPHQQPPHQDLTLFIQMELCDFTLQDWIESRNARFVAARKRKDGKCEGVGPADEGRRDGYEALRIVRDVVSGLEDIKPKNIYWFSGGTGKTGGGSHIQTSNRSNGSFSTGSSGSSSTGSVGETFGDIEDFVDIVRKGWASGVGSWKVGDFGLVTNDTPASVSSSSASTSAVVPSPVWGGTETEAGIKVVSSPLSSSPTNVNATGESDLGSRVGMNGGPSVGRGPTDCANQDDDGESDRSDSTVSVGGQSSVSKRLSVVLHQRGGVVGGGIGAIDGGVGVGMRRQYSRTEGVGTATYASPEQLHPYSTPTSTPTQPNAPTTSSSQARTNSTTSASPTCPPHPYSYTSKSDMYSLGIVLFELLNPFETGMERVICFRDLREMRTLPEGFVRKWPKEAALILWLTSENPDHRPSASELLRVIDDGLNAYSAGTAVAAAAAAVSASASASPNTSAANGSSQPSASSQSGSKTEDKREESIGTEEQRVFEKESPGVEPTPKAVVALAAETERLVDSPTVFAAESGVSSQQPEEDVADAGSSKATNSVKRDESGSHDSVVTTVCVCGLCVCSSRRASATSLQSASTSEGASSSTGTGLDEVEALRKRLAELERELAVVKKENQVLRGGVGCGVLN
ncbi:Eukaryotic translation initiation factor 2-alpha kinase [Quaeritorhiza haematococci]|nr:Eukaryotic translation initiation factor 2-alpha kinase [Quaeritorhiza haematococci]